jgi:branched-subunit amino acid transport protein AzlD
MGFEPLGTDEQIEPGSRRKKDFESELVSGCFTIIGGSVLVFLLTWWPFLVWNTDTTANLIKALLSAAVPSLVVGAIMNRKYGLAGGVAFGGGMIVGAVFLYLHFNLALVGFNNVEARSPEYPEVFRWIVPLIWFFLGLSVGIMTYKNPENPA